MHPNLLAYKDYEVFNSEKDLKAYRNSKLESVKKNVHFIEENFNKKVRVLEIGSGNSKFLYALDNKNLLESGYGVEVSENIKSLCLQFMIVLILKENLFLN